MEAMREYCNDRLVDGFLSDLEEGASACLVIEGLEELGGRAHELVSCILGLFNEERCRLEWAEDFRLRLECERRSVTFF